MKKVLRIVAIAFAVIILGLQFVRPDQTNPPTVEAETLEASSTVPENIAAILKRSCSDCHTNSTNYPWYAQITPANWFLDDHVQQGRSQLNFSVWATYTPQQKAKKLDEVCEQIEAKDMPLPSYLWLHRDAVLTADDSKALCDWAMAEKAKLAQ